MNKFIPFTPCLAPIYSLRVEGIKLLAFVGDTITIRQLSLLWSTTTSLAWFLLVLVVILFCSVKLEYIFSVHKHAWICRCIWSFPTAFMYAYKEDEVWQERLISIHSFSKFSRFHLIQNGLKQSSLWTCTAKCWKKDGKKNCQFFIISFLFCFLLAQIFACPFMGTS